MLSVGRPGTKMQICYFGLEKRLSFDLGLEKGLIYISEGNVMCVLLQAGKIMLTYQSRLAQNVRWIAWALLTVSDEISMFSLTVCHYVSSCFVEN